MPPSGVLMTFTRLASATAGPTRQHAKTAPRASVASSRLPEVRMVLFMTGPCGRGTVESVKRARATVLAAVALANCATLTAAYFVAEQHAARSVVAVVRPQHDPWPGQQHSPAAQQPAVFPTAVVADLAAALRSQHAP